MSPTFPFTSVGRTTLAAKVLGFGGLSALGLGLDCGLFIGLVALGLPPAAANLFSAAAAVTLVFFASVRRIFCYQGGAVWLRYVAFIFYQCLAVFTASAVIGLLAAHTDLAPLTCKLLVLPATFTANYLMMGLLTRPRTQT